MYSSETSGFVRSPGFGQKFEAKKFKNKVDYKYEIRLPSKSYDIIDNFPNLYFVLHFHVDVQLYEGREYVLLTKNDNTAKTEWFYNTGNVSIIRKYKYKDIK